MTSNYSKSFFFFFLKVLSYTSIYHHLKTFLQFKLTLMSFNKKKETKTRLLS